MLLVETPEIFVDDYLLQLPKGKYNEIGGYVKLNKPQAGVACVTLRIPELNVNRQLLTDKEGRASFRCKVKPELWTSENPKRYTVEIQTEDEIVKDKIGFRQN